MEMMHMNVVVLTEKKGSGTENLKNCILFFSGVQIMKEEKNRNVLQ